MKYYYGIDIYFLYGIPGILVLVLNFLVLRTYKSEPQPSQYNQPEKGIIGSCLITSVIYSNVMTIDQNSLRQFSIVPDSYIELRNIDTSQLI